jgi:predicted ATPase/DNA-binding SARP family transcriptional activator
MTGERGVAVAAASGTLQVALLGGFSVRVGSRAVPGSWRLRKSKTLVKLLALADGHRAHRDVLAGVLWPALDPVAAANNLHQALHAARRALASDRPSSADTLWLRDDIVILWPGGELIIDADMFAAAAQQALRSGVVEDYEAAVKLYTGELLPEDRDADWAAPHRDRLAALHQALTAGHARALLERRRPEEAVALLEPVVTARPADEPLHRVLMAALDQAGLRWDALDVYERLRRVLDEEYAAAPEAATLSLYRRILSGQSSAGPASAGPASAGPASAGPAVASNLPAAVTSFIGRRREIAELLALADRTRLLTLSGTGGAGKTRLAIEVARRLASADVTPDGVWLVDLSGLRDGRLIPAAAGASLGLALTDARPTMATVVEQLADRRMVVLLDNCEHLLAACAEFAMALLERCAGVALLATSREPLRLPGEVVWRVPSLELPDLRLPADPARLARLDSVQLFVERAANAAPAFRLDAATALPVARICMRLDGIPLALELAASRIAHLAAAELATRLDDALATLAGEIRGVPDRQATLAATLDWSHALLTGDERAVFRRLSVFAGGFALEAAEEVCADGLSEPVAVVVSRLVDKSLVSVQTSGDLARFRLLEVIRQYAAGCLASSGELTAHQRRHALWYASRAEALDPDLGSGVVGEPSPWFAVESGNLRAALSTSLREMPDRALVMAVAMWRSWMARGLHAEGLRWLTQALEASPAPAPIRARALFATAVLEIRLGRPWRCPAIGAEIAATARHLGDPGLMAEALHQQTLLTWLAGEWEDAARLASEAGAAARSIASVRASHEHLRALLALFHGETPAAQTPLDNSLSALGHVPPDAPPFFTVCTPGWSVDSVGDLLFPVFEETMLVGRRVGPVQSRGYILATQALAARMSGCFDEAGALLEQALQIFRSLADGAGQAHILAQRGHLLRSRGDPGAARECFRSAADLRAEIPDRRGTAIALTGVALAEAALGDGQRARALGHEACGMLDRSGDLTGHAGALNNLAVAEVFLGCPEQAIGLIEGALALRATPSLGWQYMLLAGLRERSGEIAAAVAALAAARDYFEQFGDRRGPPAAADLGRRLGARGAKPMQSPRS